MAVTPIIGAPDWAASQASPWVSENKAKRMIEALARSGIIEDRDLAAPPGACADGACYLIAGSPTGLWAGHAGELALSIGANAAGGWYFIVVAVEGVELWVRDENIRIRHTGAAWVNTASFGTPFEFTVAASDEVTPLVIAAAAITFEWPVNVSLTAIYAFVTGAADSSGPVEVDVNDDGVSMFTTRPTIDPAEHSSRDAAIPAVLTANPLACAAGSVMTVDIEAPGDGATGLKITFIGTRT